MRDEAEAIVGKDIECKIIGNPLHGGQKIVFPCVIDNQKFALKFIILPDAMDSQDSGEDFDFNSIYERAVRETSTMESIDSPYLVRMGPVKLTQKIYNGEKYIFYTEEWIEGRSLRGHILNPCECIQLGIDISCAIKELAAKQKIHRDIKPDNIMQRENGHFVLLDLGLLYDRLDRSLTRINCVPGTIPFFSPEQLDPSRKRDMDFRSDMFSLGIVMFMSVTGLYPFGNLQKMTDFEIESNILKMAAPEADKINAKIPHLLSKIIGRLLEKHPSRRYRSCDLLIRELKMIN